MPIFPVAQNLQAIWQPIWEDTQSVDRGMPTLFRSGAAAFLPFCGSYRKITVSTCNPSWSCSSNFMVVPFFETTCRTTWLLVATNLFPIFSIASLGNPGSSPSQVSSLVCLGCRFCTKAWMVVAWDGFLPHSSRYACSRSVSYTELLAASFLRPELDLDMVAAPFAARVDGLGHLGRNGSISPHSNLDRRRNRRSNPLVSRVPNRGNRRVCPRDPPVPGWMGSSYRRPSRPSRVRKDPWVGSTGGTNGFERTDLGSIGCKEKDERRVPGGVATKHPTPPLGRSFRGDSCSTKLRTDPRGERRKKEPA